VHSEHREAESSNTLSANATTADAEVNNTRAARDANRKVRRANVAHCWIVLQVDCHQRWILRDRVRDY
jgi:hypothetical protein